MRETAITLLTCVTVLLSAPVALAAPPPAAVEAPGDESPSEPSPSSPSPAEPPEGSLFPRLPLPSQSPAEPAPSPTPTPSPTPVPEPSGTDGGPGGEDGDDREHEDVHTGLQSVHRRPTEPSAVSRDSPPGLTDRTTGPYGGRHYGDYDYSDYDYGDDDHGSVADTPYAGNRAAPHTGQLLPVLPLGAGLALLGLGLTSFALRLRR
ncbi:MAG TPA: hypothetical protein VFY14_15280 [Streptomyces sp.]|nr:hypothetical protein [Streptomyces sp.]